MNYSCRYYAHEHPVILNLLPIIELLSILLFELLQMSSSTYDQV